VKTFLFVALIFALSGIGIGGPIGNFGVSAGSSFLEQSANDDCSFITATAQCSSPGFYSPTIIDLNALNVHPGDLLAITYISGFMCYYSLVCTDPTVGGIFSSSSTLLNSTNLNRLPGGISSGLPGVTTTTYFSLDGTTVMPVDNTNPNAFLIPLLGSVNVVVPSQTQFLFLGILDSFFADNSGNATVSLSIEAASVPEPATCLMVLAGIGAVALLRRRLA